MPKKKAKVAKKSRTEGHNPAQTEGAKPSQTEGPNPAQTERAKPSQTEGPNPAQTEGAKPSQMIEFKCKACFRDFKTQPGLEKHKCSVCNNCGVFFKKSSQLKRHIENYCHAVGSKTGEMENRGNAINNEPSVCEVCQRRFLSIHHLNQHKLTHTGSPSFKCNDCDKSYDSSNTLNRHRKQAHEGVRFQCSIQNCDKSFVGKDKLTKHMLLVHINNETDGSVDVGPDRESTTQNFPCTTCLRNFGSHQDLEGHICFECDGDCKRVFTSYRALKAHQKLTEGKCVSLICNWCQKKCRSVSLLNRHMTVHTGERPHPCDECGKRFTEESSLNSHKQTVHKINGKTFQCTICNKNFATSSYLKAHMETVHAVKGRPFQCTLCLKRFPISSYLKSHMQRVHLVNGKPFQCKICNRNFSTLPYLKSHMRIIHKIHGPGPSDGPNDEIGYGGENNTTILLCKICLQNFENREDLEGHICFECDKCKRKFKSQVGLTTHKTSMHAEKGIGRISCAQCKRSLANLSNLKSHMRTVHKVNGRRFKCTICNRKYPTTSYLKGHMRRVHQKCGGTRMHTGELLYSCSVCKTRFTGHFHLKNHELAIHSIGEPCRKKCKYCGQRFFKTELYFRNHQRRCERRDNWKCVHCETVFNTKKMYMEHVRDFCRERTFSFKCFCKTSDFNPKNIHKVLKHVIKCKPKGVIGHYKCYICNHQFQKIHVPLHIQDELLHTRLIERSECVHECKMCLIAYPSEDLLTLHNEVEHPCLTYFLKNRPNNPIDPIDISTTPDKKELLKIEREKNLKIDLKGLTVDGYTPSCQCYLCYFPFHCKIIKGFHERLCGKQFGIEPRAIPRFPVCLYRIRRKIKKTKLSARLAQKIFNRIKFDLDGNHQTWAVKVGTTFYWRLLGLEFRLPPYLIKKWLTTIPKGKQNSTREAGEFFGRTEESEDQAISLEEKTNEMEAVVPPTKPRLVLVTY